MYNYVLGETGIEAQYMQVVVMWYNIEVEIEYRLLVRMTEVHYLGFL